MDCDEGPKVRKEGRRRREMTTHVMTGSLNFCHRELLEVVLLQRWQNARFEALIIPDEHAYI